MKGSRIRRRGNRDAAASLGVGDAGLRLGDNLVLVRQVLGKAARRLYEELGLACDTAFRDLTIDDLLKLLRKLNLDDAHGRRIRQAGQSRTINPQPGLSAGSRRFVPTGMAHRSSPGTRDIGVEVAALGWKFRPKAERDNGSNRLGRPRRDKRG